MPSASQIDHPNPTIPELLSPLRDSFKPADFDRVEQALISRESNLKRRHAILQEAADFEKLEALRLAEELNALKKKKEEVVSDEGKEVIWQMRKKNRRLETERSFLERECEAFESRIVALEDDVARLITEMCAGSDHIHNGRGGVNLETVFDSLIAAHKIGALQFPAREAKLNRVIEKQKEEFAKLEKEHKFEMQKMQKVENELKVCKAELDELKEDRKVLEEKHQNECKALEQKHQSYLLEVENELKQFKAELVASREEKDSSKEKYKKLLEEVNKNRKDEDELVNAKEKEIFNEKYEKHLEEEHRKDEDEVFNLGSQKNKKVNSEPKIMVLENEISRIDKLKNELKHRGLKNMDKRGKNNKMTDGSRKQKSIPLIPDPNHAINVEDLYDSVPANSSPRGTGVGNSGKAPILLTDSDDDCAPREAKTIGLKRKRASSPSAIDDNSCGHKIEQESFPTVENNQNQMLRHCGSLVSNIGKQNNPSSCDAENLRLFEEKIGEKQKSEDASSTKVNFESDSSSSFSFSSDDSKEDDDINPESLMLFKTNRA